MLAPPPPPTPGHTIKANEVILKIFKVTKLRQHVKAIPKQTKIMDGCLLDFYLKTFHQLSCNLDYQ
jgi:hypothetical protein